MDVAVILIDISCVLCDVIQPFNITKVRKRITVTG